MALCLKVRDCEIIHIGPDIYVTIAHRRGKGKSQMMIWIEAPKELKITRDRGGPGKLEHLKTQLVEEEDEMEPRSNKGENKSAMVSVGDGGRAQRNGKTHVSNSRRRVIAGKGKA